MAASESGSATRNRTRGARVKERFCADLVMVGFGNVGRRFVQLLDERAEELRSVHGIDWRVIAIATGRHGCALDPGGIDTRRAVELVESGRSLETLEAGSQAGRLAPRGQGSIALVQQAAEAARSSGSARQLVVVETTVLDISAGQPAIDHVRAGLRAGAHVVTANKGPVAFAYAELSALARSMGRAFLFEGAVMDGIPIFNMVEADASRRPHLRLQRRGEQHHELRHHGHGEWPRVRRVAGGDAGGWHRRGRRVARRGRVGRRGEGIGARERPDGRAARRLSRSIRSGIGQSDGGRRARRSRRAAGS